MHRDRKAKAVKRQTEPWRPLTFDQATDITDVVRRRRSLRRRMIAMRVFTIMLVVAAVVVGATPFVLQWNTSRPRVADADRQPECAQLALPAGGE